MTMPNILSTAQLEAADLFGVVEVERRGLRKIEPAYGKRAMGALLRLGYVQDDAVMQRVLREAGIPKKRADAIMQEKVVVRHTESDGRLEVIPNIPGITDDNISLYDGSECGMYGAPNSVIDDRNIKYKLNHVFTDTTLVDKLRLSPRRVQVLKRLAVSDPAGAAASLMDYLKVNGFPNVVVTAGDYARSLSRMREVIRQFAQGIRYQDSAASAVITPDQMIITFDGFEEKTPLWSVYGPIKYATEVQAIYQMAIHYGPERLMFLLGVETALLRINIYDEKRKVYVTGLLEGYSSLLGIEPYDPSLPSGLTVEQQTRLLEASKKVHPVFVDGLVTGTAVHVADKHWIVNEHTLTHAADADKVPVVKGEEVTDWRSVGNDVAMIKRTASQPVQWVLRNADLGERVVLCFSVGTRVEYSEVLRVQSTTEEHLILSDSAILRKGASGAVAVALKDSALLGIFSTKRGPTVVCSVFGSASFVSVTDFESVVSSTYQGDIGQGDGEVTYARMVRRGLQGFLEGIDDASTALYTQREGVKLQAGLVASLSDCWQTTVDPDAGQLVLADGKPLIFRGESVGRYTVVAPPPVMKALPNVRSAVPGERVFCFTKTDTHPAMTAVRVVMHCTTDVQSFSVEDFGDSSVSLAGALIVAEKDAAVVGQFLKREVDVYGESVTRCVSLLGPRVIVMRTRVDTTAMIDNLKSYLDTSDAAALELSTLGVDLIKLTGEQLAFRQRTSLVDGGNQSLRFWEMRHEQIADDFGLQVVDWEHFRTKPRKMICEAFMAVVYMADPGSFAGRLQPYMVDVSSDRTPTFSEFPFHRPASVGSNTSRGTRVPYADDGLSHSRLKDLEARFEALAKRLEHVDAKENPDTLGL